MTNPGAPVEPNEPMDPRLGRRPGIFDPRNLDYRSRPLLDERDVQRKDTYWRMPQAGAWPLDQGQTPECTGFGTAHEAACGPIAIPGVDAAWAHRRYVRNVDMDHAAGRYYNGGATVQATMAAGKTDGVFSGYVWNLGLDDTLDALCTVGPQCLGTTWKSGMFSPTPDGLLQVTGADVGGHFYILAARVENHPKFGAGAWMIQSWGEWGVGVPELGMRTGCAFITDHDLGVLLSEEGESVAARDLYNPPAPTKAPYFAASKSAAVFHDVHPGLRRVQEFATYGDAQAAGLRPCRICRPKP
jgi:hypothetical protein